MEDAAPLDCDCWCHPRAHPLSVRDADVWPSAPLQRSGSSRTSHGSTPHGVTRQAALLSHAAGVIFSFPFRGVPSSGRRADLRPPTLGQLAARAAGRVWRLVGAGAVELRACVASGMVSVTSLKRVGSCARHTGPHHRVSRRRQASSRQRFSVNVDTDLALWRGQHLA